MKWILRIIITIAVLIPIVLAVVLVPAHLQVRGIDPELPSQQEMLALRGDTGPTSVSYILTSNQTLERGQISHISIVVEWANGKRFLIDTGMSEKEAKSFAKLLQKMDSTAGSPTIHGTVSQLLGSGINQVAGVGFTHLHIDHTQGIENFCAARGPGATLFQAPTQKRLHNFNTTEGADLLVDSCLTPLKLETNHTKNFFTSEQFPGIAAVELGGHTPGSTLWTVALGDTVLLFSGDITNDKASIDNDVAKPALYSYLFVPENTERTASLRKWLAQLDKNNVFSVVVSHDLANTKQFLSEFKQN